MIKYQVSPKVWKSRRVKWLRPPQQHSRSLTPIMSDAGWSSGTGGGGGGGGAGGGGGGGGNYGSTGGGGGAPYSSGGGASPSQHQPLHIVSVDAARRGAVVLSDGCSFENPATMPQPFQDISSDRLAVEVISGTRPTMPHSYVTCLPKLDAASLPRQSIAAAGLAGGQLGSAGAGAGRSRRRSSASSAPRPQCEWAVPPELSTLITKCWDPTPANRGTFAEALAVLDDLATQLAAEQLQ
jgi:hypothetical protein